MEPGEKALNTDVNETEPGGKVLNSEMNVLESLTPVATGTPPDEKCIPTSDPMSEVASSGGTFDPGGKALNSEMDMPECLAHSATDTPPGEMYIPTSDPSREVTSKVQFAISSETFSKIEKLTNCGSPTTVKLLIPNKASSMSSLAMPTTSLDQTTPIPLATPILITSPSAERSITTSTRNILNSLFSCRTSLDPLPLISSVREELYGVPSMVQRLVMDKRLREHQGCVNCINFSWQGDLLASSSDDLHVVLWDWRRGRIASKFDSGHVANVFQVRYGSVAVKGGRERRGVR